MKIKMITILLLAAMLLSACGEDPAPTQLELNGAGYRTLTEANGVCYLVDTAGSVYTLDWMTGARTFCFQAPGDESWAADPAMQNLYLIREDMICRMDTETGQTESIYSVDSLNGEAEIIAVTDHYLLYRQRKWNEYGSGQTELDEVYCLSLDTLECSRMYLKGEGELDCILHSQGDKVYALIYDEVGMKLLRDANRVEVWDLETGEKEVLATHDQRIQIPRYFGMPPQNIAGMKDGVLYYSDFTNAQVCAAAADGEVKQLEVQGAALSKNMFFSPDGAVLAVCRQEPTVKPYEFHFACCVYAYDAATDSARELAQYENYNYVVALVSNGDRYAMLISQDGSQKLVLGDVH